MIKVLERLEIQGTHFNIIKTVYSKPTASIYPHGEKLKEFPLRPIYSFIHVLYSQDQPSAAQELWGSHGIGELITPFDFST